MTYAQLFAGIPLLNTPVCIIIALVSIVVYVRLKIYRYADFTMNDAMGYLMPIDCDHGTDLLHPGQDAHYIEILPAQRFRRFQGKRVGLSFQFIGRVANNAKYLRYLGVYELRRSFRSKYRQCRSTSRLLLMTAIYCQLLACALRVKLYIWLLRMALLPFLDTPNFSDLARSGNMMYLYEKSKRAALILASHYGSDVRARLAAVL